MDKGSEGGIFYFDRKGEVNTDKTLDVALACCRERKIGQIVVASSTGKTALRFHEKGDPSLEIIAVTYGAGSRFTEEVEAFNRNREALDRKGIRVVRGLHALSGVERTFENRYKGALLPLNVVADTLRMFSQGMKVCVEIAIMAVEHGLITQGKDVVAVAGTGEGADTAVVLRPGSASALFETRIRAILCMPA